MIRRILFVDDEPRVLEGLRRMLHPQRAQWLMRFADGGAAALEMLRTESADVVVTDMRMPGMDGARLLEQVAVMLPEAIRVVLSGQTDAEASVRAVPVAHQFLAKPCDPALLHDALERAWSLRDVLRNPDLRRVVGGIEALPSAPTVYLDLGRVLADPNGSVDQIARIIEGDASLTAKLLQLVNSAFFGQQRQVSSVTHAAALLGTGLIRTLTLSHSLFLEDTWGRASGLSLEAEQRHGLAVAGVARSMLPDRKHAETAAAAGILHDLGKLILASRLPAAYRENQARHLADGVPLHQVERARFNVSHAEVGAYLLGLWGLPHTVVEAVAHHHEPIRSPQGDPPVMAAVHVADALVHGVHDGAPAEAARLDAGLAERMGWTPRLDEWRAVAREILEAI